MYIHKNMTRTLANCLSAQKRNIFFHPTPFSFPPFSSFLHPPPPASPPLLSLLNSFPFTQIPT